MPSELNLGALEQRVRSIESGHAELRASISSLQRAMDEKFGSLTALIQASSQTPWGVLASFASLLVVVTGALGYMALEPIRQRQNENIADLRSLQMNIVPRPEHAERWRANEKDFEAVQRQIDDIRIQHRSIYGAADIIRDLNQRLQRVEEDRWKPTVENLRPR